MILEHVHITIAPERVADYLAAFEEAWPQVQCQPGCHSCRLLPKVDAPDEFLLLIEWESKEYHTKGFRESPEYAEWSRLLHPFYGVFPTVDYFEIR